MAAAAQPQRDGRVSEYELKAAVLYNLFRFTEWPADRFSAADAPYVLCIVGIDPLGASMTEALRGRQVNGRGFRVRTAGAGDPLDGCHLAFISESEMGRAADILKRLERTPTLTVADYGGFGADGGMVTLFTEASRIRFAIADHFVRRAGLHMDALLLSLSRPDPRSSGR